MSGDTIDLEDDYARDGKGGRMRAWMYQLNPDKGRFRDGRRSVPTTVENLFRLELPGRALFPLVEGWNVSQFFRDAKKGDPILLRSGGSERLGVIACGRIESAERDDLSFRVDRHASNKLRTNPISYDWLKRLVPASRSNLVKLEPYWAKISVELSKRGVDFGNDDAPTREDRFQDVYFESSAPVTEEGRRYVVAHLHVERKNRKRVLAGRSKPYRCDACGFSFGEAFGPEYAEYIQVHHQVPVSLGVRTPRREDFALLCANCHVVAHWKQPSGPIAVEKLRSLRLAKPESDGPPQKPQRTSPPVDPTPGSLGLFLFRLEEGMEAAGEQQALLSVLDALADLPNTSERVLITAGEVHQSFPQLGHLLLNPPAFLVGIDVPEPARRRVFEAWQRVAPSTALSAGAVNCSPDELGLPGRIQLRGDTVLLAEEDERLFAAWAKERSRSVTSVPAERFAMGLATGMDPEELEELGMF